VIFSNPTNAEGDLFTPDILTELWDVNQDLLELEGDNENANWDHLCFQPDQDSPCVVTSFFMLLSIDSRDLLSKFHDIFNTPQSIPSHFNELSLIFVVLLSYLC